MPTANPKERIRLKEEEINKKLEAEALLASIKTEYMEAGE